MNNMLSKRINVGFVSSDNPYDRKPQSGTNFQVFHSLSRQENLNVYWIPFKDNFLSKTWLFINKLIRKITGIKMVESRCVFYVKLKKKSLDKRLIEKSDVLFCPFTQLVSVKKKTIYMSDAVFQQMVGYYWNNLPSFYINLANELQQKVLDEADKIVIPSEWAKECVVNYYKQSEDKILLAEYGANIDNADLLIRKFTYDGHLHILFLGIDWERKGGLIAVEASHWLNMNGIKTTLHIIGPKYLDDSIKNLPYVDYVGFLNKNDKVQYQLLIKTISMCHCLLLPTKAECTGIVFCESSAYGLPAFSYNTGGVSNYVLDGRNGYLLPLGSLGKDFGQKIKECLLSGELENMSVLANRVYNERLNWDSWGNKVSKLIIDIVNN